MTKKQKNIILAIETSCDETCVAFIETKETKKLIFKVLSNIVSSQIKIHRKWGGVYPTLAKREHQKNLPPVLKKAQKKAGHPEVDLIAVVVGPGLEPCLWAGINFAKRLSKELKKPIIPVNHIEAHIYANWSSKQHILNSKEKLFPALCLIVSGGHTQLILMKDHGNYKILGETRDDAAGECFDKIARILGLQYPGGPEIEKEASKLEDKSLKFKLSLPRPMMYQKNYDFSFSGLKTAVLYNHRNQSKTNKKSKKYIRFISKEAQQAIIDVLLHKTLRAAEEYKVKTIILGGGVTANKELRKQFRKAIKKYFPDVVILLPNKHLCMDNGVMVGIAAYLQQKRGIRKEDIEAKANLGLK